MVEKRNGEAPPIPDGLGKSGANTWQALTAAFEFHAGELLVLEELCRTRDTIALLEKRLAADGPMIRGSRGQSVLHPAITPIANLRTLADRLTLSLALPADGERVGRRRSPAARQAANTGWQNQARRGRIPGGA